MKNIRYLFLLIFIVMLTIGLVSAADNSTGAGSDIVKKSSSMDIKSDSSDNSVEYTAKSTGEINSIVNDAKTGADSLIINVNQDSFVDDEVLLINLGNDKNHRNSWSYYPTVSKGIEDRNQSYKNVIINANNITMDLGADLTYEDLNHISMDSSAFGDDTIYCGIIEVGEGYTLTFNNVNLERYDILNYGTVIFNNSVLKDALRQDFVCDNHGNIIIDNSTIDSVDEEGKFINDDTARLSIINSDIYETLDFISGGNVELKNNVIADEDLNGLSDVVSQDCSNNTFNGLKTIPDEDDVTDSTNKMDTTVSFGKIEGFIGESIPVNIYVNDENGDKVNDGSICLYFGEQTEVDDGKGNMINPITVPDERVYDVVDGVATFYMTFNKDNIEYPMMYVEYSGNDYTYNPGFNETRLSLNIPLNDSSVINEEDNTSDNEYNGTITVDVIPRQIKLGESVLISGILTDNNNNPLTNRSIDVLIEEGTSSNYKFSFKNVTTDENGKYSYNYTPKEAGKVLVTATYDVIASNETTFYVNNANTAEQDNNTKSSSNNIVKSKVIKATIPAKSFVKSTAKSSLSDSLTLKVGFNVTLSWLNNVFNEEFNNKTLLIYIDGILVFNGTVSDDSSEVLFQILDEYKGQHVLKVVEGDNTYQKDINIL